MSDVEGALPDLICSQTRGKSPHLNTPSLLEHKSPLMDGGRTWGLTRQESDSVIKSTVCWDFKGKQRHDKQKDLGEKVEVIKSLIN